MPEQNPNPTNSSSPKAFDIIAPGKSAPLASRRPIIVSNRPVIRDPMFPGHQQTPNRISRTVPSAPSLPSTSAVHHDAVTTIPQPAPSEATPTAPVVPKSPMTLGTIVLDNATSRPPAIASASSPRATSWDRPAAVHPTQPTMSTPFNPTQAPTPADPLLTSGTPEELLLSQPTDYYLPITTHKRHMLLWILLTIIVVGIICAILFDLALDAGIIQTSHAHSFTHFFN